MGESVELNGRAYALPSAPTVVICVDGCAPEYVERAVPFFIKRPLNESYQGRMAQGVHNYDVFDFAINGLPRQLL